MGDGRRRRRHEVRVWRHCWSSSGLLASLAVVAATRAALILNTGWTVTSTGEERG